MVGGVVTGAGISGLVTSACDDVGLYIKSLYFNSTFLPDTHT